MVGARAVRSKWILFADADTWYEEGIIESIIYAADANGLSFVSVHLKLEPESFAEHVLTPYAEALFFAGINPRRSPEGAFYGHCVLVRREAYEFIGGHGASLTFLLDDVKLALLAQRHRMKLGLARTTELGHARYHKGWKGLWQGIPRNAFRFTLLTGGQGILALAGVLLGALWVPVVLLAYSAGWPLTAVFLLILPMLLMLPWYGSVFRVWLAPVAFYAMLPMMVHALYRVWTTNHVEWKGRQV
jgi:chlorobactene glucosyltransferase